MTYKPNFTDPRTRARCTTALGFVRAVMSSTEARAWSTRYIDKYFGQQQNKLSKFLRVVLLEVQNEHWSIEDHKCKTYLRRDSGCDYIYNCLNLDSSIEHTTTIPYCITSTESCPNTRNYDRHVVAEWCKREFAQELESGAFEYQDKSSRLWHPMQNVRSQFRNQLLGESGFVHQYDIDCAAPRLIMQQAQHLGMDLWLPTLNNYLDNKVQIRLELAAQAEVDTRSIKILINALFCGARLGRNEQFALSQLLHNDPAKIEFLKQHEFIQSLREEIRECWAAITPTMPPRFNAAGRKLAPNSKRKWGVYFELERTILNSARDYMDSLSNRYFLEHDGWSCQNEILAADLIGHVHNQTGFWIKLEHKSTLL